MQIEQPKIFRDMTDAEKGALLLAAHRGKVIEAHCDNNGWVVGYPSWDIDIPYRVKPEPVTGSVTLHGVDLTYHSLHPGPTTVYDGDYTRMNFTFPTVDGKHIPGVYISGDGRKVIVGVAE